MLRSHPIGLLGRILLILLLAVAIEFGASTLLYERASQFSVREDEANRLAEHLVIARRLISEAPVRDRLAAARELTTDRYDVRWSPAPPAIPALPRLTSMEQQVLAWEPSLANSDLHVRLAPISQGSTISGEFQLPDGGWVLFSAHGLRQGWSLTAERVMIAVLPALIVLLLSALMIRVTLRPLRTLIRSIGRIGSGEQVAVPEEGISEVRGLIHAVNAMQERIHELVESRTQALAAVGHDLRTPLSRLQLRLDAVRDTGTRDAMLDDVTEMEDMIASLLAFLGGDGDPEPPARVDLAVMLTTLVHGAQDRGYDADYAGPEHLERPVRPSLLRRAVSNLIENALQYGEQVRVTLSTAEDAVRIAVEDDGPGIPSDKLEAAQRPFVRLDDARARNTKGLGLGLAIVAQAIARENGRLTLENRAEGGLRATLHLPRPPA